MVLEGAYVMGRAQVKDEGGMVLRAGGARLMHALADGQNGWTLCAVDTSGWSRQYFSKPIAVMMCLRCSRMTKPAGRTRKAAAVA